MTAQACCVTVLTTFRLSAQPGAEARLTVVQARGVPPKLPPLPSTRGGRREQLPTPRRDDELPRGSQAEAWGSREAVPHGGDTLTPPGHGCPWGHAAALPLRARSLPGCPARWWGERRGTGPLMGSRLLQVPGAAPKATTAEVGTSAVPPRGRRWGGRGGGARPPPQQHSTARSLCAPTGTVAETGTIAGIASALAMALIGAVSSYISYQQKKFCFSIQRKCRPISPPRDRVPQGHRASTHLFAPWTPLPLSSLEPGGGARYPATRSWQSKAPAMGYRAPPAPSGAAQAGTHQQRRPQDPLPPRSLHAAPHTHPQSQPKTEPPTPNRVNMEKPHPKPYEPKNPPQNLSKR